jgi:phage terminase large subunit
VRDRVNCVNSRLKSADENVHLYIDPKCRELIKDLEQVTWALDSVGRTTSEIDKRTRDRTHTSDALGYYIAHAFPLRGSIGPNSSGPII